MKALVTGGHGFIGTYVVKNLVSRGYDVFSPTHKEYDLRLTEDVKRVFEFRPDYVVHLAANVGGIGYHVTNSVEIVYDTTVMGLNMMKAAQEVGVKKFVNIGTSCSYPQGAQTPLKETVLWEGYPNVVTAPYGIAKMLLMLQGQVMRKQTGFKAITLIPANVYGPYDSLDVKKSHVIPALTMRFIVAKSLGEPMIIWGTGRATREFIHATDCAEAIAISMESYDSPEPINLGTGIETPIKSVVETIAEAVRFQGEINWDTTKPDGAAGRVFDISRMRTELGFEPQISLKQGIEDTVNWYISEAKK